MTRLVAVPIKRLLEYELTTLETGDYEENWKMAVQSEEELVKDGYEKIFILSYCNFFKQVKTG